jgi:hypothetical protein
METKKEFLPQFRKATQDFDAFYRSGMDYMEIHNLGIALCDKIREVILTHPGIGRKYLKENLVACLDELRHAEIKFKSYRDKIFKELPKDVDDRYEHGKSLYYTIEDTISNLVELILIYTPENADKFIVLTHEVKSVADLISRFLPAYNPARRELLIMQQSAPPQQSISILHKRGNIFNPSMPLEEVRRWFTKLANTSSKNGSPFLTVEQVDQFVKRAFEGESFADKLSMNTKNGDKGTVIGLFHSYYIYCVTHKTNMGKIDPVASREKYIRLLTDHFDNWTFEEVRNNFRRGGDWENKF